MEKRERLEKKHPYHFHPLILFEKETVEGFFCEGCSQPISAPFYACDRCLFFLHKFCLELPKKITHFFHTQHPLCLNFRLGYFVKCDVCGAKVQEFFYRCDSTDDDFVVDIRCASMMLKFKQPIEHASHTHKLVPLDQSAMFVCNVCNTKHEGNSFLCTECGFWVNQKCASSPTTVKLRVHDHPLTLLFSIRPNVLNCQICSKEVTKNQWVYSCREPECKYFVHMRCSTSKIEQSSGSKAKSEARTFVRANVMELPWTNDSAADDLIAQLIKNISSRAMKSTSTNDDVVNRQSMVGNTTLVHIHQHPLIYYSENIQIDHHHGESSSSSFSSTIASSCKQSENKLCNGCGYTILTGVPFYYCAESKCNDFCLHPWCARLPNEQEHMCHPQHKLVLITPQSPYFSPRWCSCGIFCDTFFFGCVVCEFYVDVKCAGLLSGIRHESHDQHVLTLRPTWGCNTCGSWLGYYYTFVCEICNHKVCIQCALLPGSVRHRYDKHPFTLTYSFPNVKDEDHPAQEYYCEICEDDIDPNHWFYHCHEYCDQSLHIKCIFPNFDNEYSNIKYKTIFKSLTHPGHSLITCAPTTEHNGDNSRCSLCPSAMRNATFAIKCTECNFWAHWHCIF